MPKAPLIVSRGMQTKVTRSMKSIGLQSVAEQDKIYKAGKRPTKVDFSPVFHNKRKTYNSFTFHVGTHDPKSKPIPKKRILKAIEDFAPEAKIRYNPGKHIASVIWHVPLAKKQIKK